MSPLGPCRPGLITNHRLQQFQSVGTIERLLNLHPCRSSWTGIAAVPLFPGRS